MLYCYYDLYTFYYKYEKYKLEWQYKPHPYDHYDRMIKDVFEYNKQEYIKKLRKIKITNLDYDKI